MSAVRISDADLARRLVLHEARAQQTPGRELRDLGDAWLLHDRSDPEPFWNRVLAPRWPDARLDFERRIDEVVTHFATLGRVPHVRPLAAGNQPADIVDRLLEAGFETMSRDRHMARDDLAGVDRLVARAEAGVAAAFGAGTVEVERHGLEQASQPPARRWRERRRWVADAAAVLADGFGVEPGRWTALENDVLVCATTRPGCTILLVRVEGEPAAVARRTAAADGSYLSSITTRPAFRRRGLGALATSLLLRDAAVAGETFAHLGAAADNEPARLLYEGLGFRAVGEPVPDMLLLR